MAAQQNSRLLASNWTPGKVTLFNALGLGKWNIQYPKLRPNVAESLIAQGGNTQTTAALLSQQNQPGGGGGNTPAPTTGGPAGTPGTKVTSRGGTPSANQTLAQEIARSMGLNSWTQGTQWGDWMALWNRESGWSNTAIFPSSHWPTGQMPPGGRAYGIAQSLGHGGNGFTEYGGFGLTPAQSRAASLGDPHWQIVWGINYIKATYPGGPSTAWAHETSHGWY